MEITDEQYKGANAVFKCGQEVGFNKGFKAGEKQAKGNMWGVLLFAIMMVFFAGFIPAMIYTGQQNICGIFKENK